MFKVESKILIVDDMLTMRKLIKKTLSKNNFANITEAVDGLDAWEKLIQAGDFDLIISDWNMPNCTGIEFLQKIRSSDKFKKLPFLMLTAESDKTQVVEAAAAGVSGYVVKPFSEASLIEALSNAHSKAAA